MFQGFKDFKHLNGYWYLDMYISMCSLVHTFNLMQFIPCSLFFDHVFLLTRVSKWQPATTLLPPKKILNPNLHVLMILQSNTGLCILRYFHIVYIHNIMLLFIAWFCLAISHPTSQLWVFFQLSFWVSRTHCDVSNVISKLLKARVSTLHQPPRIWKTWPLRLPGGNPAKARVVMKGNTGFIPRKCIGY